MAEPPDPSGDNPATSQADHAWFFRCLLRGARVASLATTGADGHPFASLTTPAFMPDLSPVLLLSTLSEHTRQLEADPRCALLVTGEAPETNPQTAPRITLICGAEIDPAPELRARYLAIHPYAALYADFTDFAFWRLSIRRASFVGGFARAGRLTADQLRPDPDALAAVTAAEPAILAHCNLDHAHHLAQLAGGDGDWRMVTADTDGCDLAPDGGGAVQRICWDAAAATAADIRAELVRKTKQASASF